MAENTGANSSSKDPVQLLGERFRAGIAAAFPQAADADPAISASKNPEFGDYQSNVAMGLAKKLGMKPREVAEKIVASVQIGDIAEALTPASIAGPGFINIRLRGDALAALVQQMDTPWLGIEKPARQKTVVVDLMGVNLAKQMHVGHLRSPVIGDAIARAFERLGEKVIRQNHVGDWGLPIAMVTARLMKLSAAGKINIDTLTLDELDSAYKTAQQECQRDLAGLEAVKKYGLGPKAEAELEAQVGGATENFIEARQTLVKLQAKEPATYAVWQKIYSVTMAECLSVCRVLNVAVTEAHNAGESSYADELSPMVADLEQRGVAEVDQGALVIRLDKPEWGGIKEPCLIRKTDGGYLYATTDICAVRRRVQKLGAERIVYAVDLRQNLHLRQVFFASKRAGYAKNAGTGEDAVMEHAGFGAVLGEDGRPFKTRSGESVKLSDLIEEMITRATAAVMQRNPEEAPEQARKIAEAVGIAALKYADLSTDRVKDYMFSFDRMLSFEGNTGPYLLNALVRIKSIFRKAAERGVAGGWESTPPSVSAPAEKQLALALLRYPATVRSVADLCEPHRMCQYLYDLASTFSAFYENCPVLAAETEEQRRGRLKLAAVTGRVLEDGLHVLGIPTLERM
ncbi:MAG TPA: arginine--tRNA ligase [Phycisphaerales bacterium]|nr:arginine--tRNA ligase [Phycisphaerales bacterium]